ncbi:hypothetical protein R80B4_01811 [Fibrobacteres bacterium R8-0-B4]
MSVIERDILIPLITRKVPHTMKSLKFYLIAAAAVIMLAATGLVLIHHSGDVEEQETRQDFADSGLDEEHDTLQIIPDSGQDWERTCPCKLIPDMKLDGKKNSDVYLQSLDIQVEVTGNIASTRHTMVFKNRTNSILEGELTFPLPDGRSVTFYALDINGRMREAVPVEKARATLVFEEIEERRVDPGLLERVEGNNFRTRVYPIPANGTRTITIGYEEELTLEENMLQYRLLTDYLDSLENFSVKATVWKSGLKPLAPDSVDELRFDKAGENYVASFARKNYRPSRTLNFSLPAPADIPQLIMQPSQEGCYFLASVAPQLDSRKKQWSDDLAIIWDVSLSARHRDLKRELNALDIIFAEKKDAKVRLYFLNNKLKEIVNKNTADGEYVINNGNWNGLKSVLKTAVFDGGTDFSQIDLNNIVGNEILFFSDGISTLSDADFIKDVSAKRPIHCVISSAKADYSSMKLIVGKTLGKFVNINALSPEKLKNELLNETPQFLGTLHGKAVHDVYPSIATPINGNFSLSGISDVDEAELTLLFGLGNTVEKRIIVKLDAKNADSSINVYKLWAQKKIAELDLNYEKNRDELMELGQRFGIVTRNTSLIVLETVEDYIRYKIKPPAELQDEYKAMLEYREDQQRDGKEINLLGAAAEAADSIKKWWNTDWTPKKPKYPTPEKDLGRNDGGADSAEPASRDDNTRASTHDTVSESAESTNPAPDSIEKNLGTKSGGASGARNSAAKVLFKAVNGFYDFVTGGLDALIENTLSFLSLVVPPKEIEPDKHRVERTAKLVKAEEVAATLEHPPEEDIDGIGPSSPVITLKPIKNDNDYLNKLTGKPAKDYKLYLELREDYITTPTFYFDMANWFYTHGDKKTAIRVLTNIADLDFENASLYRLLGYRFKEYGEYALEKFVCQKVIQWRPLEPQSYRDYALALADNGEKQAALDSLYGLLARLYSERVHGRSYGIEEVAVTEINHLIAKNANLNTSKIDTSLLMRIPVDIRVVINWNMNNTDIDLHVKDPNNDICHYGVPKTDIGGRISGDIVNGYGPEQFLLKKAIKGKYQVYVHYFGDRQHTSAGPSTVMAEIFTKYAGKTEQRKVVCLQLSNAERHGGELVTIAEFDF